MRSKDLLFLVLSIILLITPQLKAQDFTHLSLSVAFDTVAKEVKGTVEHRITGVKAGDSLFLNGIRMQYDTVLWNGAPVQYSTRDTGLSLFPKAEAINDTNTLLIRYRASPRKGIYFVGFNDTTYRARRQIWTQGQGIDHRHWIPHNDDQTDKVLIDLKVTFQEDFELMANGELIETRSDGGEKTWHYRLERPMSSYLIALALDKYAYRESRSASGVLLRQYFYPERADDYQWYYRHNEKIFNFLEDEIGYPYPWPNYKQAPVRDFRHGAMENTTATIFGDFFLVDEIAFNDRNYTYVNAHELAHQWFGNYVTASGSKHHWLHEGFATYYQWLSEGHLYGREFYDWELKKAADLVFAASETEALPLAHPRAGSSRFYQKGGWLLHMLREKLGDTTYRQAMQNYLQRYALGVVDSDSLQVVLEENCSCSLDTFFGQWLYHVSEPVVSLSQSKEPGQLKLHYDSAFHLPIIIEAVYQDGQRKTLRTATTQWEQGALIPLPGEGELAYWRLQNAGDLLAHWRIRKPLKMWERQYEQEKRLYNRYLAVEAMQEFPADAREDFLEEVLENEREHYGPRAEALRLLITGEESLKKQNDWLYTALNDADVQLQKKAILFVEEPGKKLRERMAVLRRYGQSYQLRRDAISLSADPQRKKEIAEWLNDNYWAENPGIPGHEVHQIALLFRIAYFGDKQAYFRLRDYASPAYDFNTRMYAFKLFRTLRLADRYLVGSLFDALFDPNWHLVREAKATLQLLYQEESGREVIDDYRFAKAAEWEDWQRKRVEKLLKS